MTFGDSADLRARSSAGDPSAMTALALSLLVGDGVALKEAFGLLQRAATLGSGEASARLSVFAAAGTFEPPDWDRALDHLQRAAEQGWAPSQRELGLLSGREGKVFSELRRSVDVAAWTRARPKQIVSEAPRIRCIPSFLSRQECAWLIGRGRQKLAPALVFTDDNPAPRAVGQRTNSSADFTFSEADLALLLVHERMAATIGVPRQLFETTALLHYTPGQEFLPHYDFLDVEKPALAAHVAQSGQRIITVLIYLNDDYEGGETVFPRRLSLQGTHRRCLDVRQRHQGERARP